jgi:hypothetical protein
MKFFARQVVRMSRPPPLGWKKPMPETSPPQEINPYFLGKRRSPKMNMHGHLDPATGFPPVTPPKPFIPEPGSSRPEFKNVAITGTLASDATDSLIELEAIRLAPYSPIALDIADRG